MDIISVILLALFPFNQHSAAQLNQFPVCLSIYLQDTPLLTQEFCKITVHYRRYALLHRVLFRNHHPTLLKDTEYKTRCVCVCKHNGAWNLILTDVFMARRYQTSAQSPLTFKTLPHYGTKACFSAQKSVSKYMEILLCPALQGIMNSLSLTFTDFHLCAPLNKHLAGRQFATHPDNKQAAAPDCRHFTLIPSIPISKTCCYSRTNA